MWRSAVQVCLGLHIAEGNVNQVTTSPGTTSINWELKIDNGQLTIDVSLPRILAASVVYLDRYWRIEESRPCGLEE